LLLLLRLMWLLLLLLLFLLLRAPPVIVGFCIQLTSVYYFLCSASLSVYCLATVARTDFAGAVSFAVACPAA